MARTRRWLGCFGLVALLAVGGLGLSVRQYYRRELLPWLGPNRTLKAWRWQGIKDCPKALLDAWTKGDPDARRQKRIALTFDDGPYPLYTPLLLDILRRYKVKATFFVVGIHVRDYPSLVRQIAADGHELANHTHRHRRERNLTQEELREEILSCERAIEDITHQRPRLFRPAGGFLSEEGIATVQDLGYTLCNATVNPGDWWQRDPELLIRFSYRGRSREGVTLMHSGALGIVRALPGYINALKAKGFEFVTVSELAESLAIPLPNLPLRHHSREELAPEPEVKLENQVPESTEEFSR